MTLRALTPIRRTLAAAALARTLRPTPMPPADPETARWFAEHVRPHESALRAYLRAHFPEHLDLDDLVQETYARLLQAREQQAPLRSPKAYLFATARNAALDFFRRRKIVAIDGIADLDLLPVLEDRPGIAEAVSHDQELQLLAAAIQALPERCRRVLTLRKLHGLSHREIAQQLGIAENTVNAQVAIGVLRLRDWLRARGVGPRQP
jgi:RNA polymerase sigma-70 factor (ECF subfamily)